jgi:heterodisulfide reductase subunit A
VISPKLVEVGRHSNIEILTLSEVNAITGDEGNFKVSLTQHPRYVDMDKCIACGACSEKCPRRVASEYDAGLAKRRAIYVPYAQAVPLKYAIDDGKCIYLTKGKCKKCEEVCPTEAINYEDQAKELTLHVGAVILSSGSKPYDPATHDVYGYTSSKNIVTSLEFERILSSSGPYGGHLIRPSDKKEPRKIAWLQCIGSRDVHIGANGYCSAVCCTYAVKEAMLAKEHSKDPLDAAIFYMDMRTTGKDFERYYNRAKEKYGVRFVKSKITHILPTDNGEQLIRYYDESGNRVEDAFDMVVLSVGLGVSPSAALLAKGIDLGMDSYQFVTTNSFEPVKTSRPGIYVCGVLEAPKDIPSSVIEASASAGFAGSQLAASRWSLTKQEEPPTETDTRGVPPRIGVFVCCCGTNIAGVIDVPAVVEYAKTLENVVYSEINLFSCSQDTQDNMVKIIKEKNLNRVVVSACTPKTHEPLFQETLINAGLNKYVFEMTNIRNQCSWVNKNNPDMATQKAKELVRMSVAKVALMEPLEESVLQINQTALVIGGGIAGITAARSLSAQGYHTVVIEKNDRLGGNAIHVHETWLGENITENLNRMIADVEADPKIDIFTNADITQVDGYVGNFKTTIQMGDQTEAIEHGVTIMASGASEQPPDQYLYGEDERVLTGLELDRRLIENDPAIARTKTALFIQCVGSRIPERPYCSKLCCTHSIRNALQLKRRNPEIDVYILYQDLRTYGLREDLYRKAREAGVQFIRYHADQGLDVRHEGTDLKVRFSDTVLRRKMEITPELIVLASAIVAPEKNPLAQQFKVTLNDDGFFMEAHAKLRPVDCATDGVFICGLAHGPKPIDESIAQAAAAATKAVTLLARKVIRTSGNTAKVDPMACSGCGVCASVCPYSAPSLIPESEKRFGGKAQIESVLCKGCGLCVASCRSGAIMLKGFDNDQIFSQIFALRETG